MYKRLHSQKKMVQKLSLGLYPFNPCIMFRVNLTHFDF